MIKIAFVIDTIESPRAGTEKQLLLLIKHLDRQKYMPYLCVLRSSRWLADEFHECPLFEIGVNSFKKPYSYWKIWLFSRFLRSQQIGIVQTYFNDSNKVGIAAALCAGTCSVISSRRNQGYWHTPTEVFLLKILDRWVSLFVANSFSTKSWAKTVEGIAEEKIRVIYNGFDLKTALYDSAGHKRLEYRRAWGVSKNAHVIGLVANLRPVKRHDVFLRAAQLVAMQYPETCFVIVGEGGERRRLELLASELGISEAVLFLGQRDDVVAIMSAMDIGVLSSDSESFSNAVVEYLAARLPVVSTDVGGSQEAIESGKNGYIVPVGDFTAMAEALCRILRDNRKDEMGKISRMKAEALFSMETMVKQYENIYVSLTREGNAVN